MMAVMPVPRLLSTGLLSLCLLLTGCTAMLMGGGGRDSGSRASDAVIAGRVSSALEADAGVDASGISVEVSRQVVFLRGTVPSAAQRVRAAEVAGRVTDVAAVRNHLRVPAD